MRRLVVALIVAALALALTGCGGGGSSTTAPPAGGTAAAPAAAPAAPTAPTIADRSSNETTTFEPFPTGSTVPTAVKDAVAAKKPTLILFYNGTDGTNKETQKIIDEVRSDNRGLVDLFSYDIGKYVTVSEAATLIVKPEFAEDREARQSVLLARTLGVTSMPFVVLTDSQGYIIWKFRGLVDKAFLEREITRAQQ